MSDTPLGKLIARLLLLAALIAPAAAQVQPADSRYEIRLQGRTFTPPAATVAPQVLTQARAEIAQNTERRLPGRVHMLVQFVEPPTAQQRTLLAGQGITLLEALSPVSFRAAVQTAGVDALSTQKAIRWVGTITPDLKISSETDPKRPLPYQVRPNQRLAYTVVFHADVGLPEATSAILAAGGIVETTDTRGFVLDHALAVQVPRGNLQALLRQDVVAWVEPVPPPNKPLNLTAQGVSNVNAVQIAPYNLNGAGITVGIWDQGIAGAHADFGARVTAQDTEVVNGDHATHVTGTVSGSGAGNANAEGMAPSATVSSYGWTDDAAEMTASVTSTGAAGTPPRVAASNHSYGARVGWDPGCAMGFCNNQGLFGQYNMQARQMDLLAVQGLVIVRSAGNDRNDVDPNPAAPPNAANDCQQRAFPGGAPGDCIGPAATAKNILTIGAVDQANAIAAFSSFGPTDDGRIKPDLVADGINLTSTVPNQNFDGDGDGTDDCAGTYCGMQGTSMATPVVTGVVALLMQQAANLNMTLRPSSYKGLLIQTARDAGPVGPDYQTGWGVVDSRAAADLLRDPARPCVKERTITGTGAANAVEFPVCIPPGRPEFHVTLTWDDPAAAAGAAQTLQNDLDLRMLDPGGNAHQPWTLNPANPGLAAVRDGAGANDAVNNAEQVSVLNPQAGRWVVRTTAAALTTTPQVFSIAGACTPDPDHDGLLDCEDNCPAAYNANQADVDGDGLGDVCDPDSDGDGIPNPTDNCSLIANPNQADLDGDRQGDLCDEDDDGDCIADARDNCPTTANCNYFHPQADQRLCSNPCAGLLPRRQRLDGLTGAYVVACTRRPVDPACFVDGCPWPEFTRVPGFDPVPFFTKLAQSGRDTGSGLRLIGRDRVVLPPSATGFEDGRPLNFGALLNIKSIDDLRRGTRVPSGGAVPKDPVAAGGGVFEVGEAIGIGAPGSLRPPDLSLLCRAIVRDLIGEQRLMGVQYQRCVSQQTAAAANCQADWDRDGRGDACDPPPENDDEASRFLAFLRNWERRQ